jgi:hypothetical protein
MINNITFGVFVERIKKFAENNWPDQKLDITSNEVLLYVYEAIGKAIADSSDKSYRETGIRSIPEGFITTYQILASSFVQDPVSGVYKFTMPSPPVNLPLGYSITAPYFGGNASKSYPLIAVNPSQVGFFDKIEKPAYGVFYWVTNSIFNMQCDFDDLTDSGLVLYLSMQTPRSLTSSDSDVISIPDDQLSIAFDIACQKLIARMNRPKDLASDSGGTHTFSS